MAETQNNSIQQFSQVLKAIPTGKKISFAITISLVVGGFIALLLWTNRPDYQVLFTNLDAADAGRITEKLRDKRVPFQLREGGRAILVPDDMVYQLRLEMASDGIPRGKNVGFEIFDEIPFGTTEFVQKLKYQQAIQGELARTIMQFEPVAEARIHIVSSSDSLFVEDEKPSTASVVLRLYPGRILDRQQLHGIINLVACAVKGLKPENVTVVDMAGGLLSGGHEENNMGALSGTQLEYQQKLERTLANKVQTILEPVVGQNKVVAKVSAEVNFDQVNVIEEKFDPDSIVVRSEQRQKETSTDGKNLPSGSPDMKYQVYKSRGGGVGSSESFQRENATINYEINKINKQISSSVGDIKRLSAAVIIDGPYEPEKGPDGEVVQKFVPRSRREMKTFEDIIKNAIGFDKARGDRVTVSNISFALQKEEVSFTENKPQRLDYFKKMAKPLLNVVLVLLFFLFAIRPFKKWLNQAGKYIGTEALPPGEEMPRLTSQASENQLKEGSKTELLAATKSNPDAAASIIRSWISEGK